MDIDFDLVHKDKDNKFPCYFEETNLFLESNSWLKNSWRG